MTSDADPRRKLPSVERILSSPAVADHHVHFGRTAVTAWVRQVLSELRNGHIDKLPNDGADIDAVVVERLNQLAEEAASRRLQTVINATGIVIHTNLGRAPLAPAAIQAISAAAACTNLEVDVLTGRRGTRGAAVEQLCRELTGAEAALIVNNCAAATLLALQTQAAGKRVIISRGQLIEIGGSFRLPDVFRQAGVELHEVGTTNRTRLADYADAIGPDTAALLRVHPSNYRVSGFVESVSTADLVQLGSERQLPVIDDVGSGCLHDLSSCGLPDEPVVADSVRAGASLVLFSGDKLLGGPQCGIIVGKSAFVSRLRLNPLSRALRVDKLTLAALQATLEIHRAGRAFTEIPVLRQLSLSVEEVRTQAVRLLEELRQKSPSAEQFSLQSVASAPGGGSLPDQQIPSWAIAIAPQNAEQVATRLRLGKPPVFTRVHEGRVLIDLRTVLPADTKALRECILAASS